MLVDRVQAGTADLGTVLTRHGGHGASRRSLGAAGTAVTIVLATRIYQTILAALREQLVGRALTLPQHLVERAGTGDLISRSSDDVTAVADAAPAVIPVLTVTAFTIVVSLGGLAALEWPYAAAFVVVLPVYALAMRWYLRTGPQVYRAERAAMSARAQQIVESQRGYATVLGFGLGEQRHHAVHDGLLGCRGAGAAGPHRAEHVQRPPQPRRMPDPRHRPRRRLRPHRPRTPRPSVAPPPRCCSCCACSDRSTSCCSSSTPSSPPLASLSRMIGVTTIADRLDATSQRQRPRAPRSGSARSRSATATVLACSTTSPSTSRPVSTWPSSAPPGRARPRSPAVIAGIHPPDAGTVTRPDRTALITQEVHVFAGTLRDNLTLAAPEASDRDIRAALEATGAAAILDLLPDGLDTLVGAGGHPLTDAQAQQLALARLLLADPELAILDEATAEAGSTHAGLLDRAAEAVLAGRTGLVIAHRLSQAATCDRIVVMEHGRIIETGTHGELVAAGGVYAGLWAAWEAAR